MIKLLYTHIKISFATLLFGCPDGKLCGLAEEINSRAHPTDALILIYLHVKLLLRSNSEGLSPVIIKVKCGMKIAILPDRGVLCKPVTYAQSQQKYTFLEYGVEMINLGVSELNQLSPDILTLYCLPRKEHCYQSAGFICTR